MINMKENLKKNVILFLKSADMVYGAGDFTSATILYFKTAFVAIDYVIYTKKGVAPKDHSDRFRIVEKDFPDFYEFLDKYFSIYRDTYSVTIEKYRCDKVRENVRSIIKKYKILE